MRKRLLNAIIPLALITGCTDSNRPYNFAMDYPVEASRLSLSGKVVVNIDCDTLNVNTVSDTSNGIFSRHIKKRAANICFRKSGTSKFEYTFIAPRTPAYDMIATQPQRTPEF